MIASFSFFSRISLVSSLIKSSSLVFPLSFFQIPPFPFDSLGLFLDSLFSHLRCHFVANCPKITTKNITGLTYIFSHEQNKLKKNDINVLTVFDSSSQFSKSHSNMPRHTSFFRGSCFPGGYVWWPSVVRYFSSSIFAFHKLIDI